jgi:hypothetical protein
MAMIVMSISKQLQRSKARLARVKAALAAAPNNKVLQQSLAVAIKENANLKQALSNTSKFRS